MAGNFLRTFDDYNAWLQAMLEKLASLQPLHLARFTVACTRHLYEYCQPALQEEIDDEGHKRVLVILDTLDSALLMDHPLAPDEAARLEQETKKIGPQDLEEYLGGYTRTSYLIGGLDAAISCCSEPSIEMAREAATDFFELVDYEADAAADDGYGANAGAPFLLSRFYKEWEWQRDLFAHWGLPSPL